MKPESGISSHSIPSHRYHKNAFKWTQEECSPGLAFAHAVPLQSWASLCSCGSPWSLSSRSGKQENPNMPLVQAGLRWDPRSPWFGKCNFPVFYPQGTFWSPVQSPRWTLSQIQQWPWQAVVFICYQHALVVTSCETWEHKSWTLTLCAACPGKNTEIVHSLNKCWHLLNIHVVWPWRICFHHFHPFSRKI